MKIKSFVILTSLLALASCTNNQAKPGPEPKKEVVDIKLDTTYVQKEFDVGDTFSYTGLKVYSLYNDKTETLLDGGYQVSTPDMETIGEKAVTVSYLTFSKSYNINVSEVVPVEHKLKIELSNINDTAAYLYSIGLDFNDSEDTSVTSNLLRKIKAQTEYYSSIETWENGQDLKDKLEALLNKSDVTLLKYDWEVNKDADESESNLDKVAQLYSSLEDLKINTKRNGQGWDKEHAWAKTLMAASSQEASDLTKKPSRATDYHNLFPAATAGNNSRGNKNFGNVDPNDPSTNIITADYRSNPEVFEPLSTEDKGIVSRALFYMATRYATSNGLTLREDVCTTGEYCHGNLSDMLEWNQNAVTRHEYKHNEVVYGYQNDRNPYVDYPELADYVFGSKQNEAGRLSDLTPSIVSLAIKDHEQEVHHYAFKNVKYTYEIGETFDNSEIEVYAVKNDTTTELVESAHVTTSIANGTKFEQEETRTVTVSYNGTQIGSYALQVKVVDVVREATYNHYFNRAEDFVGNGADLADAGKTFTYDFGGVTWTMYRKAGRIYQQNATKGTQFGSNSASSTNAPCELIYLESTDIFEKYNFEDLYAIYFEGNTNANKYIDIKFYIDDEVVFSDTIHDVTNSGIPHYLFSKIM